MGKSIEVILLEDVKDLGRSGDTCKVRAGYARNFLFPKKRAVTLTPGTRRLVERKKAEAVERLAREKTDAEGLLQKLEGMTLKLAVRANADGRLFGSVDAGALSARLAEVGMEVRRQCIVLEEPIKTVGEHVAALHLHPAVRGHLKIKVVAEKARADGEGEEPAKG